MDMKNLVEVLLFASPKLLTQSRFLQVVENKYPVDLKTVIDELNIEYRRVTNIEVPKELVNPIHYCWDTENRTTGPTHIKEKIEYQKIYYDGECGYAWDEKENRLTEI